MHRISGLRRGVIRCIDDEEEEEEEEKMIRHKFWSVYMLKKDLEMGWDGGHTDTFWREAWRFWNRHRYPYQLFTWI
jgi:hypothetical protein